MREGPPPDEAWDEPPQPQADPGPRVSGGGPDPAEEAVVRPPTPVSETGPLVPGGRPARLGGGSSRAEPPSRLHSIPETEELRSEPPTAP
eukprot:31048-Pyramimonas_sp.AAC.1